MSSHHDAFIGHNTMQVLPVRQMVEAAPVPPPPVARHSVFPASLQVDGSQVHPKALTRLLKPEFSALIGRMVHYYTIVFMSYDKDDLMISVWSSVALDSDLKQVVGDLLGDGDVQSLGDLVDEAQHVVVGPAHLVEIVGLLEHL